MNNLLMVLLGSLVVLIQTLVNYHDNDWQLFAVVVSGVSTVCCLVLLILARTGGGKTQDMMHVAAAVLCTLWFLGTACMTVKDPYRYTGNGYFGSWVALIFSWLLAVEHYPSLRAPLDHLVANSGTVIAMLILASLVVFCQTLWLVIDHHGFDHGETVWIFLCSGFSLLLLLLLHARAVSEKIKDSFNLVVIFLFIWWCVGWFIATFDAPYRGTGNGFFGCWVALLSAFVLADTAGGLKMQQHAQSAAGDIPRWLLGVALGSVVVLVAVTYNGCWGRHNDSWCTWAFICSCVSTVLCVFFCVAMAVGSGDKLRSSLPHLAIFLFFWWIAGTGIMTFEGPFRHSSNGYFGAWLALVSATILCHDQSQSLRDVLGRFGNYGRLLVLMFVASGTLMIQVLFDTIDDDGTENILVAWIVAAGALAICLVMMVSQAREDVLRILMVIQFLLWAVGVGVLTFDGPYAWTGNAYFACWCGLALSTIAVWRLYPDCVQKAVPEAGEPPAAVVGVRVV